MLGKHSTNKYYEYISETICRNFEIKCYQLISKSYNMWNSNLYKAKGEESCLHNINSYSLLLKQYDNLTLRGWNTMSKKRK